MFSKFVNGTNHQVTMAAALRRSNTYSQNVTDKQRKAFREGICGQLEEMAKQYTIKVSDQQHLKNIKRLQKFAASNHHSVLKDSQLKLGVAQKALNLYLKLQWSQGQIVEPPHCPLDAVIIKKLPIEHQCNWTDLNDLKKYKALIKAVKKLADAEGKSIAEWELVAYQE
jgi:hypothetical protein